MNQQTVTMRRRSKGAVLTVLMALILSSCSWTSGAQYFVHWSPQRQDVIIRERASYDLALAFDMFYTNNDGGKDAMAGYSCHANFKDYEAYVCVIKLLNQLPIAGIATMVWKDATNLNHLDDFASGTAFAWVRLAVGLYPNQGVSDCLTLSVGVAGINWTHRVRSDENCLIGKHTWEL